ncbi:5-carboxymethyl-2-hydroxymuconate Delta-isomerase [Streptomyces sp. NPDC058371]|uniref:5-carboxymethyl-2-hydroxymuconate Delta-isomerase n=1 Tax=Streptomyces sp. NPDC058371 TaxID=3346463 RepID=UPI00365CF8C4
MPQITVDYSATLDDAFDRAGFAPARHAEVVDTAAARIGAGKTQFRRTEDTVAGADLHGHAIVHVTIALPAGRTDETKAKPTEAAPELLKTYVKPADGLELHASAAVRDLDTSYRKFEA